MSQALNPEQKRRIRRNAFALGLVAFGFFVAFIVAAVLREQA